MARTAAKKTQEPDGSKPDFESALARLEEIVEKLDDGNLPLAQSLALFKEGTALSKRCRDLLSAAEIAVKEALHDDGSQGPDEIDEDATDGEEPVDDDDGS